MNWIFCPLFFHNFFFSLLFLLFFFSWKGSCSTGSTKGKENERRARKKGKGKWSEMKGKGKTPKKEFLKYYCPRVSWEEKKKKRNLRNEWLTKKKKKALFFIMWKFRQNFTNDFTSIYINIQTYNKLNYKIQRKKNKIQGEFNH